MHQGYELRPIDCIDVQRIATRFGLPIPASLAIDGTK